MADENQNNAEITQSINGLKTAIQSLQKDMRSSSYTEMKDAVKDGVKEASEGEDIQRVSDLKALGYDEQDAQLRIAANTELVRLREQQESLKNLQQELGGLGAKDSSVLEQLEFDIDFELKNNLLNAIMKRSFNFGLNKIADAFEKRALELYK